jgi:ankyrin repeat protein
VCLPISKGERGRDGGGGDAAAFDAEVNPQDRSGRTPLHLLSERGPGLGVLADEKPNPVLEMLLRSGSDVDAVTNYGQIEYQQVTSET